MTATLCQGDASHDSSHHTTAALDAYLDACNTIRAQMEALATLVDEHHGVGPDDIHWGHIGDMNSIKATLDALVAQHG